MQDLDGSALRSVLRAKTTGAMVLHELFPPGTLDFLVLYSSAGQLLHLPGQGAYAAANAFLDALARHRRSAGCRDTVSLAWTSWRGEGMSADAAAVTAELAARGTAEIGAAEALDVWDHAGPDGEGELAVLRVLPGGGVESPPLLRELAGLTDAAADADSGAPEAGAAWQGRTGDELRSLLLDEVLAAAALTLGVASADVPGRRPLVELGVDSLRAVQLRTALQRRTGTVLPPTLLWNRPTAAAVAEQLAELLDADRVTSS